MEGEITKPAHRPSLLTDEMIEKARRYLMGGWQEFGDVIPSFAGLSCYLEVSKKTIYNWIDTENPEFLHITNGILALQENRLINGGLSNQMNAQITKLILGKHGYSERIEQDINATVETPSLTDFYAGQTKP